MNLQFVDDDVATQGFESEPETNEENNDVTFSNCEEDIEETICDKTVFEYTMKLQKYFIALSEEKEARQLDRMINLIYQTIDVKLEQKTINDFFKKA